MTKAKPDVKMGRPTKRGVRKVSLTVRITPELKRWLTTQPSAAEAIEDAMRRTKAFREWAAAQGDEAAG